MSITRKTIQNKSAFDNLIRCFSIVVLGKKMILHVSTPYIFKKDIIYFLLFDFFRAIR